MNHDNLVKTDKTSLENLRLSRRSLLKHASAGTAAIAAMSFLRATPALAAGGAGTIGFSNIAALRASSPPLAGSTDSYMTNGYYTPGDSGGNVFYWDAASVEPDNGGTIIQINGVATGRYKAVNTQEYNVRQFGARGDGGTDDTAAFLAILAIANVSGHLKMKIPTGIYKITSTLTLSNRWVSIVGDGLGASRIDHAFDGDLFSISAAGAGSTDIVVSDLWILRTSGTTTGATFVTDQVGNGIFQNLYIQNARVIFNLGIGAIKVNNNIIIENVFANVVDGGIGLIMDGSGGAIYMNKFSVTGGFAHTSSYGVKIVGNCDVFVIDSCYFEQMAIGLAISPSGVGNSVVDWWITDTLFDDGSGIALLIQPSNAAPVARGRITGCWFAHRTSNIIIQEVTGGTVFDVFFGSGNEIVSSQPSIVYSGKEIYFDGVDMYDSISNGSLLTFSPNLTRFGVKNSRIGARFAGVAGNSTGITIGANCADYEISHNDLSKNTIGMVIPSSSLVSTALVHGNKGYNPLGNVVNIPAVPASNVYVVNPFPSDAIVSILTGTITAVYIKGALGASQQVSTGRGSFSLPRGASIAVTYSAAPTWKWFVD